MVPRGGLTEAESVGGKLRIRWLTLRLARRWTYLQVPLGAVEQFQTGEIFFRPLSACMVLCLMDTTVGT